mmetsp:Transcript_27441/g.93698  ORF Transcript_27441/g.93698 Transcript_27441/m.93698 type:complete len:248 (-) Transcript_27441:1219-1962(-)
MGSAVVPPAGTSVLPSSASAPGGGDGTSSGSSTVTTVTSASPACSSPAGTKATTASWSATSSTATSSVAGATWLPAATAAPPATAAAAAPSAFLFGRCLSIPKQNGASTVSLSATTAGQNAVHDSMLTSTSSAERIPPARTAGYVDTVPPRKASAEAPAAHTVAGLALAHAEPSTACSGCPAMARLASAAASSRAIDALAPEARATKPCTRLKTLIQRTPTRRYIMYAIRNTDAAWNSRLLAAMFDL